jgi:uncharacterized protein YdeI (YjbR/CyaY-like superfamily)
MAEAEGSCLSMDVITFKTAKAFEVWLKKHHAKNPGIWVRFFNKAHRESSGEKGITYAEALDVALCYGWIDSQAKGYDDTSHIQRYTPRGKRSIWSKRNREHVARLIKDKRMTEAGLAQVEAAKKDGRWDQAYDSPANMKVPADFLKELAKSKKAHEFFKTLNKTNLYAIGWRLQTAKKPETRERRMKAILEMLKRGEKFH